MTGAANPTLCLIKRRRLLHNLVWSGLGSAMLQTAWAGSASLTPAATERLPSLRLAGQSRLRVFGLNIYDAQLWTQEGFSAYAFERHAFALQLRYLRAFKGAMIAERSLKEMRRFGPIREEQAEVWLAWMRQSFPDVSKGDELVGVHPADGTARFVFNGRVVAENTDPAFTRLFFGIWLHPRSSEPTMRAQLLGSRLPEAGGAP